MPIPLTWPLGAVFWIVWLWAFWPELRVAREARQAQRNAGPDARDPSYLPLIVGQRIVMALVLVAAIAVPGLAMRRYRVPVYLLGVALLGGASALRRHCFRMLGSDFRGAVTVRPDQPVVDRGAYRHIRHPSYVAGLLLHAGIALALTNWGSLAIALLGAPPLFVYRIRVEERALLERLGAPYAAYMSRTSRLVPGVW